MLVYGHFWSFKTISRRSENHKFSRDRFFLFGPGRARREQPNAGLHLGVRAFVRSVSHVKVFLLVCLDFFLKFCVLHCVVVRNTRIVEPHLLRLLEPSLVVPLCESSKGLWQTLCSGQAKLKLKF